MFSKNSLLVWFLIFHLPAFFSCNGKQQLATTNTSIKITAKPGSSFAESLRIDKRTVVFYAPDSLQNEKIKSVTDKRIFEGNEHDFIFQQRFGHRYLKEYWPQVFCINVKNFRYLLFVKNGGTTTCIDLDKMNDAYGMFVFDGSKEPKAIEMTNLASLVPAYFNEK